MTLQSPLMVSLGCLRDSEVMTCLWKPPGEPHWEKPSHKKRDDTWWYKGQIPQKCLRSLYFLHASQITIIFLYFWHGINNSPYHYVVSELLSCCALGCKCHRELQIPPGLEGIQAGLAKLGGRFEQQFRQACWTCSLFLAASLLFPGPHLACLSAASGITRLWYPLVFGICSKHLTISIKTVHHFTLQSGL